MEQVMSMPTQSIDIDARPEHVFDALADARTYPRWLVGAQRIRRVDEDWPATGCAFHHTVGVGPLTLDDRTTVVDYDRPRSLRLRAGVGPLGSAHVDFELEPGPGGGTRLHFAEEPESGLLRMAWRTLGRPLMRLGIWGRNAASLSNLKAFVEAGGRGSPDEAASGRTP